MKQKNLEKVWVIQRAIEHVSPLLNLWKDWPEYSTPMTYDEMMIALKKCEDSLPYEFRGHNIRL